MKSWSCLFLGVILVLPALNIVNQSTVTGTALEFCDNVDSDHKLVDHKTNSDHKLADHKLPPDHKLLTVGQERDAFAHKRSTNLMRVINV